MLSVSNFLQLLSSSSQSTVCCRVHYNFKQITSLSKKIQFMMLKIHYPKPPPWNSIPYWKQDMWQVDSMAWSWRTTITTQAYSTWVKTYTQVLLVSVAINWPSKVWILSLIMPATYSMILSKLFWCPLTVLCIYNIKSL